MIRLPGFKTCFDERYCEDDLSNRADGSSLTKSRAFQVAATRPVLEIAISHAGQLCSSPDKSVQLKWKLVGLIATTFNFARGMLTQSTTPQIAARRTRPNRMNAIYFIKRKSVVHSQGAVVTLVPECHISYAKRGATLGSSRRSLGTGFDHDQSFLSRGVGSEMYLTATAQTEFGGSAKAI
jgi:hypothetical protein